MALDLVARLVRKMPVQSGNSSRGEWSKQEFIVETLDMYPRKICMNVWGADKISELKNFAEGETLRFSLNIESREYNGRWYTDVRAWRVQPEQTQAQPPVQDMPPFMEEPQPSYAAGAGVVDDMPF